MIDPEYLKKRSRELGLGRQDTLARIQQWLEHEYPERCRALSLNDGVLRITTPDSAVASELRLRQTELLGEFSEVNRVTIQIRSI